MLVEYTNNLRGFQHAKASQVVIYNEFNEPVAAVLELAPNQYMFTHAGEPRFAEVCSTLGLRRPPHTVEAKV